MSDLINLELVQALNPLYAFPIVAVILCAFIVYAFGFKSPVQPPSFDGIEEEKKIPKKRKAKESNKNKVVQNGKLNGSTTTKAQVVLPAKKKEVEKPAVVEKQVSEKPANEKKANKKSKQSNEKKVSQEKKKESFSPEDTGEDGWVQLISKKGRKNRKKDEVGTNENQVHVVKPEKSSQMKKSDEITLPEESLRVEVIENSVPEKKDLIKEEKEVPQNEEIINEKPTVEEVNDTVNSYEKLASENLKDIVSTTEKASSKKNTTKGGKSSEETNKKNKKKKSSEVKNPELDNKLNLSVTPAEHVISEPPAPQNTYNSTPVITEVVEITAGKVEENQPKETKSSNVVFDELAGLYPEPKESRKKKKVRRDH